MSKLDNVISKLSNIASKVMPGHKFTFNMAYFPKDSSFQLNMSKDYGHTDGAMFFLSGTGESTEDAAEQLLNQFQAWCNKQIVSNNDEIMKVTERLKASSNSMMGAVMEASKLRGLFDEAVDTQLP